jgi:hypothetical protein
METCRRHFTEHALNVAEYEAFETLCLDVDGLALVEYALALIANGCTLNLGSGQRRMLRMLQAITNGLLGQFNAQGETDETRSLDQLDDYSLNVDQLCCGSGGELCPAGQPPSECSPGCALALHSFTTQCASTIESVLQPDDPLRETTARLQSSFAALVTLALSTKFSEWNCSKPRLMRTVRLVRRV